MSKQRSYRYTLFLIFLLSIFLWSCETPKDDGGIRDVGPNLADPGYPLAGNSTDKDPVETDPVAKPGEVVEYKVTKEVFEQTFTEVRSLIDTLNTLIANGDQAAWESYLSKAYREHYTNADVLRRQSESPILKTRNIKLLSISDYFRYVVVPSRAKVRLDDLYFISETEVEAIMQVGKDQRVTVYRLIRINKEWKISLASEG